MPTGNPAIDKALGYGNDSDSSGGGGDSDSDDSLTYDPDKSEADRAKDLVERYRKKAKERGYEIGSIRGGGSGTKTIEDIQKEIALAKPEQQDEEAKIVPRGETFSEAARKRFGIKSLAEGTTRFEVGGRARIVDRRGRTIANIPTSAQEDVRLISQFKPQRVKEIEIPTDVKQVSPELQQEILAKQYTKPIRQTAIPIEQIKAQQETLHETLSPKPEPRLSEEVQRGLRRQIQTSNLITQTPSNITGEVEIIKPTTKGDPIGTFFTEGAEELKTIGTTLYKGGKEIFLYGFEEGYEARQDIKAGFTPSERFEFARKRLIKKLKKPEVQAVGTIAALALSPTPVQLLVGGAYTLHTTERFLQEPSGRTAAPLALIAASAAAPTIARASARGIRNTIQNVRLARRYGGKVIVLKDLPPGTTIRGRQLVGMTGNRKTLYTKKGSVQEGVINLKFGELQQIDPSMTATDFVVVRGKQAMGVWQALSKSQTLPTTKLGAHIIVLKKGFAYTVPRKNLGKFIGELKFIAESGTTPKATTVSMGKIKQTVVSPLKSKNPTIILETTKATVSPIRLSAGKEVATIKTTTKAGVAKSQKMIGDSSTGILLLEQIKVTPEPIVIKTPSTIRVIDPTTSDFFEIKTKKGTPFSWLGEEPKRLQQEVATSQEVIKTDVGGRRQQQILLQKPKTRQKTILIQESKQVARQKQTTRQLQQQKPKLNQIFGRESIAAGKLASKVDSVLGIKTTQRQGRALALGEVQLERQKQRLLKSQAQSRSQAQLKSQLQLKAQGQLQEQGLLQQQAVSQAQLTAQQQILMQELLQIPRPKIPRKPKEPKKPKPRRVPKPKDLNKLFSMTSAQRKKVAYHVLVKEKGKFKRVSSKPLPRNKALNLGYEAVDNTPSATFKLKKTGTTTKKDDLLARGLAKLRKKKNLYIEKRKYRIDTQGEFDKITVEGWKAKRRKKLKWL